MPHDPSAELGHDREIPPPATIPAAWTEPITIGSEPAEETDGEGGFVDDRFTAAEIGVGDDVVAETAATDETPAATLGLGNLAAAMATKNGGDSAPDTTDPSPADGTSDTPTPPSGGADDTPPELPPLITTGEEGPHRGEALREVITYAEGINPDVKMRTDHEILENAQDLDLEGYMAETGLDMADAVEALGHGRSDGVTSLREELTTRELDTAEEQYSEKLEAAGVMLETDGEDIFLEMTDPGYFTEAVGQMPAPAHPDEQAAFDHQMGRILDNASFRSSYTIISDNSSAAIAAAGGHPPDIDVFDAAAAQPTGPDPEQRGFAAAYAENAAVLASHLESHGAPAPIIDPIRQLGIAHATGMATEWAVGVNLDIVGNSRLVAGVDRLDTAAYWGDVYNHFDHLARTAPNAEYTREVRDTLLADIQSTLDGPPPGTAPQRQRQYEQATPLLRRAQERIRTILPDQPPQND
jgi:hypothetical protein